MLQDKSIPPDKEDVLRIIGHELRGQLTAIKASSEMLSSQKNLNENDRTRLLDIISTQTAKMFAKVDLILDAAHIDKNILTITKAKTDLRKIIDEAVISFKTEAQNKSISLKSEIDISLPLIDIDSQQIKKVISILLDNSLKFTPSKGEVSIKAVSNQNHVTVSISDTGTGIADDQKHLLFTKFGRIDNTNASPSTGLGLYVAKGIIEAHGGDISLKSEPNKGTTVTLSLPLESRPPTPVFS